jgi:TATA-box binding protein (TBP) (component of TFIID and TFIIIB)
MAYFSSTGAIQVSIQNIINKYKTAKGMCNAIAKRFESNNDEYESENAPFLVEPFLDTFGELSVRITNQNGKVSNWDYNSI